MRNIVMRARRVLVLGLVLISSLRVWGDGWTPSDAGLVANLKQGDRFMISVWIDDNNNGVEDPGEEYFVCDYPSYTGGKFNYKAGNFVKLIPQTIGTTEPSAASIWTVDTALTRTYNNANYALTPGCGINMAYTMWGNTGKTLICGDDKTTSSFKFLGYLSSNRSNANLCDAIFVVPTVRPTGTENMDPNGTLEANHLLNGRTRGSGTDISPSWAFDGKKGIGFGGRAYREVYWFVIPRSNSPIAYTNAALVTFNTTNETKKWSNNEITCLPGMAAYAFGTDKGGKHNATTRTVFRFYNLTEEIESCADSYFFAHDQQDYTRFRTDPSKNNYTTYRKIYSNDHLHCMERDGNTKYYKTDYFRMQFSDSTYYYIGKNNVYYAARNGVSLGSTAGAYSQFRKFSQMRITGLANAATAFRPSEGACGRIVVDTTSGAENLGATFEPAGYFLKVSTGKNIRLHPNADSTVWTCDEMWHITDAYAALKIKATTFTGPRFREDDPGADIDGWSEMVVGNTVPLITGGSIVGVKGWARIYTDSVQKNGYMVFVPADTTKCLHYDNNGFLGVQVPNQYAEKDVTDEVEIREGRLKDGYIFDSWNTQADGLGTTYHPGDKVTLTEGTLTLYAQATYVGQYNVAISFLDSTTNKRYFLSHPGTAAPNRFAHARTYTDWTNVRQGLSNEMNDDPNHITTYELFEDTVTHLAEERLFVLTQETLRGYEDTLLLNEDYFSSEDYLGLYYQDPNVILANENWVGLFKSSGGWPDYEHPVIDSTILSSTHYNTIEEGVATRQERANKLEPYVQYNPSNQFDGIAEEANATRFQLSTVVVADEHYIIQPDTTDAATGWTESITFGFHESPLASRQVWSKLIGKQLMAAMFVGDDTIYFHPNSNKLFETASQLRLSADFRLSQNFNYIRDARVESIGAAVRPEDKPSMEETSNEFCRNIRSGQMSPMNVQYNGAYIDIVDTLRVSLNPGGISKIKEYYGWWKTGAEGVHVRPDGSRYRDILVTTKTYHYGPTQTAVQLKPAFELYEFPPLKDHSRTINFAVVRETSHQLLDANGTVIRTEVLNTDTVKNVLDLSSATYTLATDTLFSIGTKTATSVTLTTLVENALHDNHDTLTVTTQVTISGVVYDLTARVPLMQTDLTGDYMIWSVVDGGTRYFVTAGSGGLQFRQYSGIVNSRLVRNNQELIIGSANAANNNNQYLTPWASDYPPSANDQLRFWTEYGVNMRLVITGETVGLTTYDPNDTEVVPTYLTFVYVDLHSNENGNVEELVRLRYGADKWLKFNSGSSPKRLELVNKESEGSVFSWTYLKSEYNLLNYGEYPDKAQEEFTYNTTRTGSIQTRYKAYKEYSILLDDQMVYVAKEADELDMADLIDAEKEWKTQYSITHVRDSRMATSSGLSISLDSATMVTTITQSGESPKNVMVNGKYVNIVDTLDVALSLQADAPSYHFKDKWSSFQSIDDAHLKIPLIRRTYHDVSYDSLICLVDREEYNHAFPNTLRSGHSEDSLYTFTLSTQRRQGTNTLNVYGEIAATRLDADPVDMTGSMDLTDINLASVRLLENGKAPSWCRIERKTANTFTIRCLSDGLRTPRSATIYVVYVVMINDQMRIVNSQFTVSQASLFQYANNQHLVHSMGASGDSLKNGMQQTHENKQILYYYNPGNLGKDNQEVELPIRERGFYGWWRWYREGKDENNVDVGDTDVPDSLWTVPPRNVYNTYIFPFRTIGDSVKVLNPRQGEEGQPDSIKKLVTQGRYTVFRYPSKPYPKNDPPSKSPRVVPPINKKQVTYVVDISNYYDNLPLSMKYVNQIDTAMLDTMRAIIEPTLSLREIFELRPWTEMADTLEHYKTDTAGPFTNDKYLEDHVVMAPTGNRLLLKTEQRYRYDHLIGKHSESLLGYYMKDDNWSSMSSTPDANGVSRQDTMIWCGGWDTDCEWFTYNPKTDTYAPCGYNVTEDDDFLNVTAKGGVTGGRDYDTVYYCLRAPSRKSKVSGPDPDEPEVGQYWFNICRYMIIYHRPTKHGPLLEKKTGGEMKALITNDEIEQDYEILERLDFDYNKPGAEYTVYPHPLPWADCSYGYSYPVGPEIPDNRQHNDFAPNFPGPGEYSLINRIVKTNDVGAWYQRNIEQHGGKENGYMLYCDGMSKAGQVAALSLEATLCEGQKLYFSGFVGNSSNQTGKSNPNFTFSVQGAKKGETTWEDITTYMTGDIQPSNNWYQIFFPILHNKEYDKFRVRIYNMASDYDGNDFVIDDMCIFATKPPLIAYQANTKCVEQNENDSIIHVVLRVDYQGFVGEGYNDADVHYTVDQMTKDSVFSFVPMIDHYLNESIVSGTVDTIYGHIRMPSRNYVPTHPDSIFINLNLLADKFEESVTAHEAWEKTDRSAPEPDLFRKGYIYEKLDGVDRPVLYVVHKAKMAADNTYHVRMSLGSEGLMNSHCAMTSQLKVTNRMKLTLDGREQEEKEISGICGNVTYEVGMRVKGTLILDGTAPQDQNGSCVNDWLLYGDTSNVTSVARYGYKYNDIVHVVKDILRYDPAAGESNTNQFARTLGAVNRNVMKGIQEKLRITFTTPGHESDHPYDILAHLVNNGFLVLYQQDLEISVPSGDSVQYVVFPILGTGSDNMHSMNMEVCPTPLVVKLKSKENKNGAPLVIGGLNRDSTQLNNPIVVLADAANYSAGVKVPVDSIRNLIGVSTIQLQSTDDPNFRIGVDKLEIQPDRHWPSDAESYYRPGDTIVITPSSTNNYRMRAGYNYTYAIEMVDMGGDPNGNDGCPIGTVPFTLSIVPSHLRWAPQNAENNLWNNPENWIGLQRRIDNQYDTIHAFARFAPLPTTSVIIPAIADSLLYPVIPDNITSGDSVKKVGFAYNTCDNIRFLPGAVIGQQQNLTYNNAIVDMTIPKQTWALRAAPVTGMISGDLFMANADLNSKTTPWEVGEFDENARNYKYGNATFWLSLYNRTTIQKGNDSQVKDSTISATAEWSKVTNGLTLSLPAAQGWAVYTRTDDSKVTDTDANIRLPKNDDKYYYFYKSGGRVETLYEENLQALRNTNAGGKAGKLAYGTADESYTLANEVESNLFVFGNPTMAYIDIWGFIADNSLVEEIGYVDAEGTYSSVPKAAAEATENVITELRRYLPPMHAIVLKIGSAATSLTVTLNANRIVTAPTVSAPSGAPALRRSTSSLNKGIMTVTAINPVSSRCVSRLLIGQGYHDEILSGEDAVLTTLNIDNFHMTNTPTTPFNIYAIADGYGLSVNLMNEVVNIPLSFYNSELPYEPTTFLWFTGVHGIDGPLVLYDVLTGTERPIYDGICLDIETPEINHQTRYYIRRRGFTPETPSNPITTDSEVATNDTNGEKATKIYYKGNLLVIRDGHVYTIYGQKLR